jgi:hypothetical protein
MNRGIFFGLFQLGNIPTGYRIVIDSNGDIVTDNIGRIIIAAI